MPLSGSAFWACVLPVEKQNLGGNTSFERGTTGWGTIQAGTIGTTSAFQQFGAWSGSVAPTSNGTAGARSPAWTAANGSAYSVSLYVRGANGIPYRMAVADSAGINFVSGGTTTFTGGGTWQRYGLSYTEPSGASRTVVVTKAGDADTTAFYLDGLQIELGSQTTYFDGDAEGCYWLGQPHNSTSVRSGTYRGGGSVVALADLGLKPDDTPGAGMPPLETLSQSFALDPGSEFLSQRASERPFVLTCKPINGTTQQDYHRVRRNLIMALKADTQEPQSPVRLWYTGGLGTIAIDAVLAGGFEMGERDGPMAEDIAARFVAHDPYWYATTEQGTSLAGNVALGSANYIVKRDALGRWGTLGANGSTLQGVPGNSGLPDTTGVVDMTYANGTVFLGGSWGTVAGTAYPHIAMYYPQSNTFGTLVGGSIGTAGGLTDARCVRRLAYTPWGSLLVAGDFTKAGGTLAMGLAQWNGGGFGTWVSGTLTATTGTSVRAMGLLGGTVFFGGRFAAINGTTAGSVAMWAGNAFGTLQPGGGITSPAIVRDLTIGRDNALYISGQFTQVGGTNVNNVAKWNGAWGSLGTGVYNSFDNALAIAAEASGKIVAAGGFFNTDGAGSVMNIAEWNGNSWSGLGSGLIVASNPALTWITTAVADQNTGDIYAGGAFNNAGGLSVPDGFARYNGYAWLPLDIDIAGQGTVNAILLTPDNALYAGGSFSGTASAAAVAQVVNTGMADAYPTFKARNNSASSYRLYQLVNTLTGAGIWFNYVISPGEEVTLTTAPGDRTFSSDYFGNIFGKILPGSNLSDFALKTGTNYISFFASSGSVDAKMYWTARSDSIDGGTTY